jgi:ubiquinone/menaquinone biosynthesis C-methylase UbiE
MTTTVSPKPPFTVRFVNRILSIEPLARFAKHQARTMMIERAEKIGVPWRDNVRQLQQYDWQKELETVENLNLTYPSYYTTSFHAYDRGNLCWEAALEVESAAYAVHSTIWQKTEGININGDPKLRQNYHDILKNTLNPSPQNILDLGCGAGMSSFSLQATYPQAQVVGLDLSPYFLAVAQYRSRDRQSSIHWLHAPAEAVPMPDSSFDLVSTFLVFHELPRTAAIATFQEAYRLLQAGGSFALMDMNPQASDFQKMPPYILTLLKSTEPYLDQYFALDVEKELVNAGFEAPFTAEVSPRHRAIVARKP